MYILVLRLYILMITKSSTSTYTRVFQSGNSQAVRIPANLRLDTDEVRISKLPDGKLLIEPIPAKDLLSKGQVLLSILAEFDKDFVDALENNASDVMQIQERDNL